MNKHSKFRCDFKGWINMNVESTEHVMGRAIIAAVLIVLIVRLPEIILALAAWRM